jgi:hypothetical protein
MLMTSRHRPSRPSPCWWPVFPRVPQVRSYNFLVGLILRSRASSSQRSKQTFPTCGKSVGAHCRHGSVHAKATRSIPAETARGNDLGRLRSETWHFIVIVASHGNGRSKCYDHNSGPSFEAAQMQPDRRVRHFRNLKR